MNALERLSPEALEKQAHRRASLKMGWYIHASVYLVVNLVLLALSAMGTRHGVMFPALGWGLGLAIHGVVVFLLTGGGGLHARLLQGERERLAEQHNRW
jgi:hypothetical protein